MGKGWENPDRPGEKASPGRTRELERPGRIDTSMGRQVDKARRDTTREETDTRQTGEAG